MVIVWVKVRVWVRAGLVVDCGGMVRVSSELGLGLGLYKFVGLGLWWIIPCQINWSMVCESPLRFQ